MDSSKSVKTLVLQTEMSYLCEELGDPGRYIPSLRSKNLLDSKDADLIRSKPTSNEKVELLIDLVLKREGHTSEHPLDILINELKKQRVQVHIARRLQRTLKKLKDSDTESNGIYKVNGVGSRVGEYDPQPLRSQVSYQSQPSPSESTDSGPTFRQSPATPRGPTFENHPSVGLIPNPPPPLTTLYNSGHTSSSENVDPEHGLRPGSPPPTSQRHLQDGTLGPSTPPKPSFMSGTEGLSLNGEHFMNGDSEAGGQSYYNSSYASIDTESSLPTISSYSTVDVENDKLRAQIEDLKAQLQEERERNYNLQKQLSSTKTELVQARKELASLRQQGQQYYSLHIPQTDEGYGRQETVVRPGTLFPTQHIDHRYRQLSPVRVEAKNSVGSQDNLSMRSANSSTSVNSNSSFGNMARPQAQSFV